MFDLNELRNHPLLKWTMYVVIIVVLISFVFFYGWQHAGDDRQKEVYAQLDSGRMLGGKVDITGAEMQGAKQAAIGEKSMMMPRQLQQNLPPSAFDRLVSPGDLAQQAANQVLISRRAQDLGVHVSRASLVADLQRVPNITDEMIEGQAHQQGFADVNGYLEYLRGMQEQGVVRKLEEQNAHTSLFEVWQEYVLAKEKMQLQLAAYPVANYTAQVKVTEADLDNYLKAHKETFAQKDMRRYAYAKLSVTDLQEKVAVTSAALQTYFEHNQAQFHQKAAFRTDEIVAPLSKDRSSSEVVKALTAARGKAASEDWDRLTNELKKAHPNLTFYNRQSTWLTADDTQSRSSNFLKRAAALADNQVSTAVAEADNVYLIKIIERRKEGTPALAEVRSRVESAYREDKAKQEFAAAATAWDNALKNKPKSVAEFAKTMGVEDQLTTRVETTESYIPGFASLYKDRAYLEGLGLHELSTLIKTDDMLGVLEVVEEIPAHDATLAEVHGKVEDAYRNEQARVLAKAQAEQSLGLLKSGAPFEQALANAPKKAYTSEPFARGDSVSGLEAPLMEFTTLTLTLRKGSTGLSPYGQTDANGYAVWKVADLTQPSRADFAKDRQQFEAQFRQVQQLAMVREWLADERKQNDFTIVNK